MQISYTTDYSFKIILYLAGGYPDSSAQIKQIADSQDIPKKFLEQILLLLKKGGFVASKQGPRATNINDSKTLVIHPASTIFADCSAAEKAGMNISEGLVRLSVGIEHVADLLVSCHVSDVAKSRRNFGFLRGTTEGA